MTSDNLNPQTHFEKEHQPQLEQIIEGIKEIFTAVDEINKKLDYFDKRLTIIEQQKQVVGTIPLTSETDSAVVKKNNPVAPMKKTIKEDNQHSTCFMCSCANKICTFYFDDLYDFDTKEINTKIGADTMRFRCSCNHLIRDHERKPSNSLKMKLITKNIFY